MIALETKTFRALANTKCRTATSATIVGVFIVLAMAKQAPAQGAGTPYPKMAEIDQYLMTQEAEVALARSAAPESIAKDADVLVLDRRGYQTASKGRNGFVCLVQRSWTAGLDDPDFWNPKLRAPICLNPPAARSYLFPAIESGAIGYMLSKQGYLGDRAGHWHPHVMNFVPQAEPARWGANLPDSPIVAFSDPVDRVSVYLILVHKWSDGSPDSGDGGSH